MIKSLLKVLLISVVLLGLAFVGLIYLVNPNQFRPAIEQAVFDSTGYHLQIAGDLDLQFRPYIGLTLQDVRLRNPGSPQELASTSAASLRVDPALLLQGRLLVTEMRADNFHINYFTAADGSNIWELPTRTTPESPDDAPTTDSETRPIDASFERILVNQASVDIQNLQQGTRYSISDLNFESRDVRFDGQPFPIALDFLYLNNGISEPVPMGLRSDVVLDLEQDALHLNNINLNVTPMLLQGQIAVTDFSNAPQYSGNFQSNVFDPIGLAQTLALVATEDSLDAPGASARPPLSFALQFNGDATRISLPSISATLGESQLQVDAEIRFATDFSPMSISYNAVSPGIDLTPFMADTDTDAVVNIVTNPATAPVEDADSPLPLDTIRSMNLLGSIAIESITAGELLMSHITVFTHIEDGVLDIESQPITVYEGTAQGNLRLDARGASAVLTTHLGLNALNIADITPEVSRLNAVNGKLNLEADYAANGATVAALLNTLSGSTTFAITENSVDIGVIKQVFTAIAALGPTGEAIQQWPDIIRFQELAGYILLENGITENQEVKVRLDNFDITGTGGLDFAAQTFDYDLLFTVLGEPNLQTIQISPRYHDISWPVECSSAFDDSVTQYCRPDFTQVRQIFTQMGTNEVRNQLNEAVTDQVPEQLQDSARGLLRNLFN